MTTTPLTRLKKNTCAALIIFIAILNPIYSIAGGDTKVRNAMNALVINGDLDGFGKAIEETNYLYPNFHLAQFLHGEFFSAILGGSIANEGNANVINSEAPQNLIEELRLRYTIPSNLGERRPSSIIKMPTQANILLVDVSRARAYLLKNISNEPVWVADFFVTIGKYGAAKDREGDLKSPIGVYEVIKKIPDKKLLPLYGAGALELNYPNGLDRKLSKTGHGIWIHGTPKSIYSRPYRASEGCFVFVNEDVQKLLQLFSEGAITVVISPSVDWLDRSEWLESTNKFARNSNYVNSVTVRGDKNVLAIYSEGPKSPYLIIDIEYERGERAVVRREYWDTNTIPWKLKAYDGLKLK